MAWDLVIRLDHAPDAPATARRRCREALPLEACGAVAVVLSELITNAVVHGLPPVELRIAIDGARARVEVSNGQPRMGKPAPDSRGLLVIDRLMRA
jgi:anti-sigma regulatory factor (Ser/Thr protein kinase)